MRGSGARVTWAASKQNSSGGSRSVLTSRLSPRASTADSAYLANVASVAFDRRGPGTRSSKGLKQDTTAETQTIATGKLATGTSLQKLLPSHNVDRFESMVHPKVVTDLRADWNISVSGALGASD